MGKFSKYVLVVDNISGATPTKDIDYEFSYFGRIRDISRDMKLRVALVEFERADDARNAWQKMNNFRMDGRTWKVDWADREDFRTFGWKWFESSPPPQRYRSRSRSASPVKRGRSRSRSPPDTPYNKDSKELQSHSRSPTK